MSSPIINPYSREFLSPWVLLSFITLPRKIAPSPLVLTFENKSNEYDRGFITYKQWNELNPLREIGKMFIHINVLLYCMLGVNIIQLENVTYISYTWIYNNSIVQITKECTAKRANKWMPPSQAENCSFSLVSFFCFRVFVFLFLGFWFFLFFDFCYLVFSLDKHSCM